MALIIKPQTSKLIIDGTQIELDSIYLRLGFTANPNGRGMQISWLPFTNEETYKKGTSTVPVILPTAAIGIEQIADTEQQDSETAHNYAALAFEQMGYSVEVVVK